MSCLLITAPNKDLGNSICSITLPWISNTSACNVLCILSFFVDLFFVSFFTGTAFFTVFLTDADAFFLETSSLTGGCFVSFGLVLLLGIFYILLFMSFG